MFSYLTVSRRQSVPLLAVGLAASLLLMACGAPQEVGPVQATSARASEPASTEALPHDAELGENLLLGCSPAMPCEVKFRVDAIRVSRDCEQGRSDFHAPIGEEHLLITVEGEATAVRTAPGEYFHTFRRPGFEDAAGPIEDTAMTSPCKPSAREKWTHPLREGESRALGQTWVMPAQAEYVILGRHRFEVPEPN